MRHTHTPANSNVGYVHPSLSYVPVFRACAIPVGRNGCALLKPMDALDVRKWAVLCYRATLDTLIYLTIRQASTRAENVEVMEPHMELYGE